MISSVRCGRSARMTRFSIEPSPRRARFPTMIRMRLKPSCSPSPKSGQAARMTSTKRPVRPFARTCAGQARSTSCRSKTFKLCGSAAQGADKRANATANTRRIGGRPASGSECSGMLRAPAIPQGNPRYRPRFPATCCRRNRRQTLTVPDNSTCTAFSAKSATRARRLRNLSRYLANLGRVRRDPNLEGVPATRSALRCRAPS